MIDHGHKRNTVIRRVLPELALALTPIAAPGMPQSAPGMDIPGQPYDILIFGSFGMNKVYERQ